MILVCIILLSFTYFYYVSSPYNDIYDYLYTCFRFMMMFISIIHYRHICRQQKNSSRISNLYIFRLKITLNCYIENKGTLKCSYSLFKNEFLNTIFISCTSLFFDVKILKVNILEFYML
ncbi:hypothetical protein GQR58_011348 [Nymphon striatum]|nr:hypothetical protein GQR58_011348 [Nymphon striatum]